LAFNAQAPQSRWLARIERRVGFRHAQARHGERATVFLQWLSGRTDIGVAFPVVGEVGAREGPVGAIGLVEHRDVRLDPALGQQVLDVAQRQRVLHAHHCRQANYLWRPVEISERVAHDRNLPQTRGGPK
jgi:hypothetical protein